MASQNQTWYECKVKSLPRDDSKSTFIAMINSVLNYFFITKFYLQNFHSDGIQPLKSPFKSSSHGKYNFHYTFIYGVKFSSEYQWQCRQS